MHQRIRGLRGSAVLLGALAMTRHAGRLRRQLRSGGDAASLLKQTFSGRTRSTAGTSASA